MELLTTSVTTVESGSEPYTLVELVGEADVTNSDALHEVLDAEVAKQPRTLIIDLSGLRFMDSSALHVILRGQDAPADRGRPACSRLPERERSQRRINLQTPGFIPCRIRI